MATAAKKAPAKSKSDSKSGGAPVTPKPADFSKDQELAAYRSMLLMRRFEEKAGQLYGMGFIGGGAILKVRDSVKGTATAASLWVTGAIGTAVGLGAIDVAVMLTIVAFVTLTLLAPLKKIVDHEGKEPQAEG